MRVLHAKLRSNTPHNHEGVPKGAVTNEDVVEIRGHAAVAHEIQAAAHALEKAHGGRGVLLGGVPGVACGKVVIIGGGVVGKEAAKMAIGLGADVTILDRSIARLRELDDLFAGRVQTRYSTSTAIEEEVFAADAVIGAVLIPGASAPKLVTRAMLPGMKKGAVLVDVAIDQGGCFETSRATTHAEPTFEIDGVVHYCVANMPGAVPITSARSQAMIAASQASQSRRFTGRE